MTEKAKRGPAVRQLVAELTRLQIDLGLRDESFAAKIGITQGAWSHIKNGNRGIGIDLAHKLQEPGRLPQSLHHLVRAIILPSDMQEFISQNPKKGDAA